MRDQELEHLILFVCDGQPDKLLGKLTDGRMFHAWLSVAGAFWDEIGEEEYALVRGDYDECGCEPVLLDLQHGLSGKVIRRVWAWGHMYALRIEIEFDHGAVRLETRDKTEAECEFGSSRSDIA